MSQVELSRRSGYSERVIRKAEAGGTVQLETIQDLAAAMSVDGHSIAFQDLTIDLASIAKRFVESYDSLGCNMLQACRDIFADDFAFNCPADPSQVPFAGAWHGPSRFQEFLVQFFGTFIWVNLHFQFHNGLVTRIDYEFDCLSVSQSLKRIDRLST